MRPLIKILLMRFTFRICASDTYGNLSESTAAGDASDVFDESDHTDANLV